MFKKNADFGEGNIGESLYSKNIGERTIRGGISHVMEQPMRSSKVMFIQ